MGKYVFHNSETAFSDYPEVNSRGKIIYFVI